MDSSQGASLFQHAAFLPIYLKDEASGSWVSERTRYVACIPKGYRVMLAIHDQFSRQMRSRLKTIGIGFGLIRLVQDAGRIGEARTILSSLENGVHGVTVRSNKLSQNPSTPRRRRFSFIAKSA